jgi:TRAP-type transport system periplasmic protein
MKFALKAVVVSNAVAVIFAMATPAAAETKVLFNFFVPPKHPIVTGIIKTWAARATKATEGRLKVSYPAKSLAPAPRQWKMVTSGIADATIMFNNFERNRLSLDQLGTLPFVISDGTSSAIALWKTHKKYFEAKKQYKGVKLLGFFMHGGGEFFSLKGPIKSIADLKRMKMRTSPGSTAGAMSKIGSTVVPTPGVKAFNVVSKGIVDGMVFPIGDVWKLKMMAYAKHLTKVPGKVYGAVFSMYMNQKKWDSLSKKDQAAIEAVSGERIAADTENWVKIDAQAEVLYRKRGIGIHNASPAFVANLKKAWAYMASDWIKTANKVGIDGKAAYQYFIAEGKRLHKARMMKK